MTSAPAATTRAITASTPTAFPGIDWHAHWIGAEGVGAISTEAFSNDGPRAPFHRTFFRSTVTVDTVPDGVPARVTADSRYVLYVNGVEVGRGPARSQPRRLRFDEYDLAPFLRAGQNTVAVLVTYYGNPTAFWQPAVANGGLGLDAVLAFEARLGSRWLVSDGDWRVRRSTAWTSPALDGLDGVPVELVDARQMPLGWEQPGFDDSDWDAAQLRPAAHIGGFGRTHPPTDPYGALLPRGTAAVGGATETPATVRVSTPVATGATPAEHPVAGVRAALDGHTVEADAITALPAPVAAGSVVTLDFGRVVVGTVHLRLSAATGTVVDILYRERPHRSDEAESFSIPKTGARYIARGADDRFDAHEVNGMRYAHLLVSGDTVIESFEVRERLYPQVGESYFRSDDPEIDTLYRAGIRTVQANAQDAYTDCPTREQRAWVGDGVVHQLVHLTTNGDWRLARNYVALGDSPRSDGILPMSVVGEIESSAGYTIPDWSLHWVHGVHNLYRYLGDAEEIRALLPTVERVLRWYLPYVDGRGTIADVPEWNLVDWSSVFVTGRSSILTALWARGLREFAELSLFVGNSGAATWADGLHARAAHGFEDFWDEARGTYRDHIVNGEALPAASQAAGATAIVSGLAPQSRWGRIVGTVTDPATLVVRSWIGGEDGSYDVQKIADQMRGVQRIDWDAERQIVIAEPFFSYLVHDAVAAAGHAGELVTLIRRWSPFLTDGYDTFGECWGWGTPVHGWSSTPTKDLVQYVLGVTPGEPGFATVRVAPALGTLGWAEGAVPTPHGSVVVRVADGTVTVDSPVPGTLVHSDGREEGFAAGRTALAL
ncbi:alpha-L-rhamnosidase-related protein [Leifsonia poae]|uniref:alpha-L-rhamnosidase-related protein n=1 Tax=Leifsonia poae TaxID=110933 RepID=UPI001CC1627C|nr:alpha-L-rhamnosidase N-terminal domain-containing protein [Leifsonia poae]